MSDANTVEGPIKCVMREAICKYLKIGKAAGPTDSHDDTIPACGDIATTALIKYFQ